MLLTAMMATALAFAQGGGGMGDDMGGTGGTAAEAEAGRETTPRHAAHAAPDPVRHLCRPPQAHQGPEGRRPDGSGRRHERIRASAPADGAKQGSHRQCDLGGKTADDQKKAMDAYTALVAR